MIPINWKRLRANKYYGWRQFSRDCWRVLRPANLVKRVWWDDTFGPLVCRVVGHNPYKPEPETCNEVACKRCHQYVTHLLADQAKEGEG